MDNKTRGRILIVLGIIIAILSFVLRNGSDWAKGAKVISSGRTGYMGGSLELSGIFLFAFWVALIFGIVITIVGISICATYSGKYDNKNIEYATSSHKCPKCGKINTLSKDKCVYCGGSLISKKTTTSGNNSWICPNCGRENMNYVGSCGCGTLKP